MSKKINFTARSMVLGGIPIKVTYSMDGETITVQGKGENADLLMKLNPGEENYNAALIAYKTKQAHKAAASEGDETIIDTSFYGMKLKSPKYYEIFMDASIGRATVTFKGKPSPEIRELVKQFGFYWSPVNKCWSRKLNQAAWLAAQELHTQIRKSKSA